MKLGALLAIAVALLTPVLDFYLYSLPNRLELLDATGLPTSGGGDDMVHATVRNCGRYTRYTGHLWWKRAEVDYLACNQDPATEGERKVIGEFKQAPSATALRIQFAWACVSCRQGRWLSSVKIPLGASSENGPVSLQLPLNFRLGQEDELQLTFIHSTDPQTPLSIGVPELD